MNSFSSLMYSVDAGVQGVEMDLRMSADSVLVLYHNETLESMTNGKGTIRENNWETISTCKYRDLFSGEEYVIRPQTFITAVKTQTVFFTFDCKIKQEEGQTYMEAFGNRLLQLIREHGLQSRCYVESYSPEFLWFLHEREPSLRCFLYTDHAWEGLEFATTFPLYGITMNMRKLSVEEVQKIHAAGLRVALFNMSTEHENLEAIMMSPDFVQTDKVEHMVEVLKKY